MRYATGLQPPLSSEHKKNGQYAQKKFKPFLWQSLDRITSTKLQLPIASNVYMNTRKMMKKKRYCRSRTRWRRQTFTFQTNCLIIALRFDIPIFGIRWRLIVNIIVFSGAKEPFNSWVSHCSTGERTHTDIPTIVMPIRALSLIAQWAHICAHTTKLSRRNRDWRMWIHWAKQEKIVSLLTMAFGLPIRPSKNHTTNKHWKNAPSSIATAQPLTCTTD